MTMTEKKVIDQLKKLKEIKPDQNWAFLTKNRIIGEAPVYKENTALLPSIALVLRFFFLRPALKLAYVGLLTLFIFFGLFGFIQNSVPGDYLYPIKRVAEQGQALLASNEGKAQLALDLADRRLGELTKIVEENKTKKLAPGIEEFQASVFEAADKLSAPDTEAVKKVVEMGKKVKELQSRGVIIEEEGLKKLELGSFAGVLEGLITDLESRTLTTKQEVVLDRMKELFEKGEYSAALELYLRNQ